MYVVPQPNGLDPAAGAGEGAVVLRAYQAWKGSNIFFLQGRFIFGPDVRSLALTIFLIVAPVAVFCVFVARHLMEDLPHNSGIAVMAVVIAFTLYILVLLLLTSGRDPGIIPRNLHPPEVYDGTEDGTPQKRLTRVKDVVVNGITVKVKYCDTCRLYRPPRCSHCSICNNCVERFDHHCPWVGQCIGQRNYRFFFMFVFSTTLLCVYVFGFCWVYITRIMDGEETTIWKAMAKTPASIVLIVYSFIAVWFVGGLSVFHLYLISTNQSTYENFRYRYDGHANPYNKGVIENFKEIFCTSIPASKNNFRAKVPKEPEIPIRTVGGGFVSPAPGKDTDDIGMGRRKLDWDEAEGEGEGEGDGYERRLSIDDNVDEKDGECSDVSPYSSRSLAVEGRREGTGTGTGTARTTVHPRRSSWGRKSGSWEIPPEVVAMAAVAGGSDRVSVGSPTSVTTPTSRTTMLHTTSPSLNSTL